MSTKTAAAPLQHRRIVAAATLFAALVAVNHATPARAQGMAMPPGAQPGGMSPPNAGPAGGGGGDQQSAWERRDMGVGPSQTLHDGAFHGPTPNQIPGGQVVTTKGLMPLLQQQGVQVYVFDVLGGAESLPNAIPAAWASRPGSFDDATQQQLGQMLRQVTQGQVDAPLVFYCLSAECWMSYNAALRAIRAGYRNVLWYRGGIEAWRSAGLPLGRTAQQQGSTPGPTGMSPPQGQRPMFPPAS